MAAHWATAIVPAGGEVPSTTDAESSGATTSWVRLVQAILRLLIGGMLFVVLWACLSYGFGTALDGPIAALIMETPCQRLDRTSERLTSYRLGTGGKGRASTPSVCYFGPRRVVVAGRIDDLGFQWRELELIVVGLVGYAACFVSAGVGTVYLILWGGRLIGRVGRVVSARRRSGRRGS